MNERKEELVFDIEIRGYKARAWYLRDTQGSKGDALIEISKAGNIVREFIYPAYKVYNIAEYFEEIVDSEINNDLEGYVIAGSTGLGGCIMPQPVENHSTPNQ